MKAQLTYQEQQLLNYIYVIAINLYELGIILKKDKTPEECVEKTFEMLGVNNEVLFNQAVYEVNLRYEK